MIKKMWDGEWDKLNRKTIGLIRQWIDDSVFHYVSMEVNAYSPSWNWKVYMKETLNKAFLICKLVYTKYKEGVSVAEHAINFQNMVNQLATMMMTLDAER